MNLEELLNLISSTSVDDTKLFFITRALKPDAKRMANGFIRFARCKPVLLSSIREMPISNQKSMLGLIHKV